MATFVYAPAIQVRIRDRYGEIYDVSDDIASWELVRRSNAVSGFTFVLQNTQRKYDRVFSPGDAISVSLKRITWVPVFTGTLNNVPIFSAWPRPLMMSASCTLKKLQFWPWDPSTSYANNMIRKYAIDAGVTNTGQRTGDANLKNLMTKTLTDVTKWDPDRIHIGAVPNQWFEWASEIEKDITARNNMAKVLGPSATIGGTDLGNLSLKPGKYGETTIDSDQAANISGVISVAMGYEQKKVKAADFATMAVMCVLVESSNGYMYANSSVPESLAIPHQKVGSDHDSVGLFQQRPSSGWGTVKECMDIEHSTNSFCKKLAAVLPKNCKEARFGEMVQTVQVSAAPTRYQERLAAAKAMVAQAVAYGGVKASAPGGDDPNPGAGTGKTPSQAKGKKGTGAGLAQIAYKLLSSRPAGSIRYSQERGTQAMSPKNPSPTRLDCSSLVSWVYYNTTSEEWAGTNTYTQWPLCTQIDYQMAGQIQGALIFNLEGSTPEHVAMSLGNGQEAAAHGTYADKTKEVLIDDLYRDSGCNAAGLIDSIDYTNAATTHKARRYLEKVLKKPCKLSTVKVSDTQIDGAGGATAASGEEDPFAQFVSISSVVGNAVGDLFGGGRQLINNQPFLPWLANVCNSSMRAFCSAPNGDFCAWFPDYFNVWGTAAIMDIKPIELQDFTVEWSDQQMVTHEYVIGSIGAAFDATSGQVVGGAGQVGENTYQGIFAMMQTNGVVTMQYPEIFKAIYGKALPKDLVSWFLERFGGRPNVETYPNIPHGPQEFYLALWRFCLHWAGQFSADVPMTFMPELWPGMLIQIKDYDFQAYVTEVRHRGSYGRDGKFITEAKIVAPTSISGKLKDSIFGVLDFQGNKPRGESGGEAKRLPDAPVDNRGLEGRLN